MPFSFGDALDDAGQHLGIAGSQPREPFRAKPGMRRAGRLLESGLGHRLVSRHGFRFWNRPGPVGLPALWTGAPLAILAVPALFPAIRCRRLRLSLQNAGPVEIEVRIAGLDDADRFLVQGSTTDTNAWRGPEPVEDTRPAFALPAGGMDDERALVAAFVLAET